MINGKDSILRRIAALSSVGVLTGSMSIIFGLGGTASAQSTAPTLAYAGGWATNGIVNPQPQANGNIVQTGIAYVPLAIYKYTGNYDYWPVLAKSWRLSDNGNELTVYLNPKAKWSNGTPVTANDVYVTFELQFMVQNAQSWGLTGMKVVNQHTIVFYKNPKYLYSPVFLEQQILNNNNILPAADFSQFIPKNFWSVVHAASGNPKASTTKAALADLEKWSLKMEGYNFRSPQNLIYDGPWSFSRTSSAEQLYIKNPYFVFAKNITANSVLAINQTTNDVAWRGLENGQLAYAAVAYSPPVYSAVMSVHDNHYVAAPQSTGMSIMFNESDYPYNLVQVRQALAYLINRHDARKVGEPIGSVSVKIPDGMTQEANDQWLTPAQRASLNPYNYNPAKATALLKSVGFKKTSKGWIMPNGKPFEITLYAENYSDWDAGLQEIASQLNSFGIKTQEDFMDPTEYYSTTDGVGTGRFPVATRWWGGWNPEPFYTYNQAFITDDQNFTVNNSGQLVRGPKPYVVDAPTSISVPGLGVIHPQELTIQLETNIPLSVEKEDVYKLARTYDYWLPAIDVWNQEAGRTYSTQNWTWPNFQNNPALLNQFTYQTPFVVYQILGLMHPKG
ncbi:MAG: ABC transporter substrate-binding protein [Firmicutes bacterium]|nr:ABC transporter substrate-binding protein [Bacillota bacterium]